MASGCLGLITFPREPGRVTLERLEEIAPRLLPALRGHPGDRLRAGALGGRRRDGDRHARHPLPRHGPGDGEDPLAPFGPNAADHVRRTDGFPHCPDIARELHLLAGSDEVAAFEELVGSHGGMGGAQSHPFVLFPPRCAYPEEEVVGAETMHDV